MRPIDINLCEGLVRREIKVFYQATGVADSGDVGKGLQPGDVLGIGMNCH